MLAIMVGLKRVRETVSDASAKVVEAASDTRKTVTALAVLAVAAVALSLIALVVALKGRRAVAA